MEVLILMNKIVAAPQHPAYTTDVNSAPLFRGLLDGLLNRLPEIKAQYPNSPDHQSATTPSTATEQQDLDMDDAGDLPSSPLSSLSRDLGPNLLSRNEVVSLYPPLSRAHTGKLIAETLHALTAIGGHENPPARHIVGHEGVASVKEKLKTVSEELEDFVEVSAAVDIERPGTESKRRSHGVEGAEGEDIEDVDGPIDFGLTH